jgi:RNA polymerase sigma factor (sigma-70 family)
MECLFQAGALGDLTDGQLLERFMTSRRESAEPAFTALVERHGSMVWGVCCRVLPDSHQAEDAFQATFLVLAQQARTVRRRDSVASWLYGVAHRVASGLRSAAARRKKHEEKYALRNRRNSQPDPAETGEIARLLGEELNRLPERLRAPLLLCDLEDATHEQAAARLGWPVGTVKSRLSRGRERLKSRLIRRGLAPSLALAALGMLSGQALASLPAALVVSTVELALGIGSGLSLTGTAAQVSTQWAREVSKAMRISRIRWGTFAALAAASLGVGAGVLWQQSEARQQPAAASKSAAPPNPRRDDDAIWARHFGNLKRIGLALVNYQSAEGHFPPAAITGKDGKPLLSWRVAILPYLDDYDGRTREGLLKAFRLDEPWDSPHNKKLLAQMPAVFASPAAGRPEPFTTAYRGFVSPGAEEKAGSTSMMMMRGMMSGDYSRTMGEMQGMRSGSEMARQAQVGNTMKSAMKGMASAYGGQMRGGMAADALSIPALTAFRERRGVELSEITDGASNTITVVEAAQAVPWTKPDDLPFAENSPLPPLGGSMRDGFAALFADGRVRLLDRRFDERVLRCLITPAGGEIISGDQLPRPDSPPPGGLSLGKEAIAVGGPEQDDAQRYAGASTLQNAVGILKDKLNREGKSELAEWLTAPKARRTIRAGLQAYESYLRRVGEPQLLREQFEIVKPLCLQIADDGSWPADCSFSATSKVETRDGIAYDHHQVHLVLEGTDRGKPFPFGILVLDVFSGPVPSHLDALAR